VASWPPLLRLYLTKSISKKMPGSFLGLFDDSLVEFSSIGKQPKSYCSFDELNGSDESMSFSVLQGCVSNNG